MTGQVGELGKSAADGNNPPPAPPPADPAPAPGEITISFAAKSFRIQLYVQVPVLKCIAYMDKVKRNCNVEVKIELLILLQPIKFSSDSLQFIHLY